MLYMCEDIVAVNDIHNETVGIGFIVDTPLLEGPDEKYSVIFNSGNPITINRRSIEKNYTLRGYVHAKFAYIMRDIIRHIGRGKYMTEQEFEKYRDEWLKSQEYLAPSKFHIDGGIKKEINNMVNKANKSFGVYVKHYLESAALTYKKIIFNGPCTIILWADGTKTIAKLYEDIDKFDPEKGVAICFMKKVLGHTETNKILRKATKQYAEETTIKEDTITLKSCQDTLKAIADRLSEPLISFNKEDK